jgi:hypothetical protein
MVRGCCALRLHDVQQRERAAIVRHPGMSEKAMCCLAVAGSQGAGVEGGQGSGCYCEQQGQEEGAPCLLVAWAVCLLRGNGRLQQPCTGAEWCLCCCTQKWSKGKMKEKVNNQVLFDKVSAVSRGSRFAAKACSTAVVGGSCHAKHVGR